jgi:16S rRNA (cytosine1402-N4)-methyltransferase
VLSVIHKPVLLKESIEALVVQPGGRYIDCTLGCGGHTLAILQKSAPGGQVLGIDADPEAIRNAQENLMEYRQSVLLVNDNFSNIDKICQQYNFMPVHGILFDLGLSSYQLEDDPRGFSFQRNAALDMRFSPNQIITAADIVNTYSETELALLLREYGEEPFSGRIARHIVEGRPVSTTVQLAGIITEAVGGRREKIHPATRTFQALRIAVNRELETLDQALSKSVDVLGIGGRLVVISYHSLEDRLVKRFMQKESKDCVCPPEVLVCQCAHKASLKVINKKVLAPTFEEIRSNPRSRSAKLRIAEKISGLAEKHLYVKRNTRYSNN